MENEKRVLLSDVYIKQRKGGLIDPVDRIWSLPDACLSSQHMPSSVTESAATFLWSTVHSCRSSSVTMVTCSRGQYIHLLTSHIFIRCWLAAGLSLDWQIRSLVCSSIRVRRLQTNSLQISTMKDKRGVKRGACRCGDCEEFWSGSTGIRCEYCDCGPAKHARLDTDRDTKTSEVDDQAPRSV